ncbi:aminoacyl-tRNA hydrolase [Arthrobacter sp. zg-Y820]|uniref:aminoacyl-tRNA hydrolase n=1 Tax=unclassified Arthrobacter TaxID=235627 RepID=UPI001E35191D|nr:MULTISPECIES: aminoacyl-tRNA hydrolase [unclassified Arthrobacter]MCC9198567.1 peptidyl-tRNA hydrolase [Arthrobacter sp. zg-Y820]MDK1281437.1 aminoacyl-tRNA hydrolase [Arthrobacter sp. zg.Y820]WIB09879.1 aminoacyl-tRNA hydrolase [Arthrobacter sp. zg-Y820]
MQPSDTVQPIVLLVDKEDPAAHLDAVAAAAAASVSAYARRESDDAWENWVFGRFTKTVRRAGPKAFEKLAAHAPSGTVVVGQAKAVAFEPVTYEEMPKALRALQVSGTQLPDGEPAPGTADAPVIVLNADLEMSTGKAGAQAAHALLTWYLTLSTEERISWCDGGCRARVRPAAGADFSALAAAAGAGPLIVDAGLTEIAPNTATAFVAAPVAPAAPAT